MDKDMKKAERRENELKHWERRLEREFNNNGRKYVDQGEKFCKANLKVANIPDDLKNSKGGRMLKHTNYLDKKDSWKDADIKNYYKNDRFMAKREIDKSIMEYKNYYNNEEKILMLKAKINMYENEMRDIAEEISEISELLVTLPERLNELESLKKNTELEICWLQQNI